MNIEAVISERISRLQKFTKTVKRHKETRNQPWASRKSGVYLELNSVTVSIEKRYTQFIDSLKRAKKF